MTSKKKAIIFFAVTLCAYIGLMIFATVCDLDISKKLADLRAGEYLSSNIFGRIFETIGEMPVYLITIFALSIVIENLHRRERKTILVIIFIILELIVLFVGYYAFRKLFKYLNNHFEFAVNLDWTAEIAYFVLSLLLFTAVNYFAKKYSENFLNSAIPWAIIVCATVILSQFITQIVIKNFAGRYRYCTMNVLDDFSKFTPWYKFNGKIVPTEEMIAAGIAKDGMKSFPSGHSCAAASLIILTSLPIFYKKADNTAYKVVVWLTSVAYVVAVMVSRIIMGKHFLSDVLTGTFVTIACYCLCLFVGKKLFDGKLKISTL